MPLVHLSGYPEDLVRFVDGLRRGESSKGRNAAADVGRVDERPVAGRADERPVNCPAEPTVDQTLESWYAASEQLDEEIRGNEGKRDVIKHPGGGAKEHASQDDRASRGEIDPKGIEGAEAIGPRTELEASQLGS